jgi:hypothetical protein
VIKKDLPLNLKQKAWYFTLKVCKINKVYTLKVYRFKNNNYFCTHKTEWYDTKKNVGKPARME